MAPAATTGAERTGPDRRAAGTTNPRPPLGGPSSSERSGRSWTRSTPARQLASAAAAPHRCSRGCRGRGGRRMLQFVFCVLMLLPLVALPVGVFFASKLLGLLIGVISLVLAIPLVLAAFAHLDLHRAKSRYGL